MSIRRLGMVGRTYRHIQRYRQVVGILLKHGFQDVIASLQIDRYLELGLNLLRRHPEAPSTHSREERIRMALEELGPIFVKLGQLLSTRPDLLPPELIRELEKLQDTVQPFPFAEAKAILESELRAPLAAHFAEVTELPLASASVAQVHRARLKNGDDVVLKVRRPEIHRQVEVDLEIMLHIAGLMEKAIEGMAFIQPTRLVEDFGRVLEQELDFTQEAANQERFAHLFENDATVYVARVYRDLTTTAVLTMEYIDGIKMNAVEAMEKTGLDRRELARRGYRLVLQQIFRHGFFHADPHPGNLFAMANNVICCLDFGMMGRLDEAARMDLAALIIAIVTRQERDIPDLLLRLADAGEWVDDKALRRDVREFLDRHVPDNLGGLRVGPLLREMFRIVSRHKLRIPYNLLLMIKALTVIEDVGRTLDPELDIIAQARPFIEEVEAERRQPLRLLKSAAAAGADAVRLMAGLPRDLHDTLGRLKDGRIKLEFHQQGLEAMMATYDRVSNRLAFAIVLGSLVIGSSLVVLSGIPPKWGEIPVIGAIGFILAGLMSAWLLVSILRRGRM